MSEQNKPLQFYVSGIDLKSENKLTLRDDTKYRAQITTTEVNFSSVLMIEHSAFEAEREKVRKLSKELRYAAKILREKRHDLGEYQKVIGLFFERIKEIEET